MILSSCNLNDSKVEQFREQMIAEQGENPNMSEAGTSNEGRHNGEDLDGVQSAEKNNNDLDESYVKEIMVETVDKIGGLIEKVSDSRNDWITEEREQIIHEEATKLVKPLSKYMNEDIAYETAAEFLEWMNCECDAGLPFTSFDLNVGFKITELTTEEIQAESINLGDGMLYDIGVKHAWHFFNDNGEWKLYEHGYIVTDDFNLTFEDIEHSFFKYDEKRNRYTDEIIPIEFVEHFKDEGNNYLVIRYPRKHSPYYGQYEVYNTKTASLDMQMTELYNP